MKALEITKSHARRFMLAHQGLQPALELEGKAGILEYFSRVGCVQYDPLNIVGRNPELVLQARVADFRPGMLEELLYKERRLLDGWDKNMSIYRIEDWPFFRRRRLADGRNPRKNPAAVKAIGPKVRRAVQERGPLSSLDLDFDQSVDWAWAPTRLARAALESLYFSGELVVHHKVNTRKVYDLARRHIPHRLLSAADPNASRADHHDWRVLRRIGGVGLLWNRSGDAWLGISDCGARQRAEALGRLLAGGKILEVRVDGIDSPFYMRSEDRGRLEAARGPGGRSSRAAVLAPLDNLLWDRRLVKDLFDFDYKWEVYKPAAGRNFGYYVLPVLHGERFIARFEPARDKTDNALIIRNWWWEPGLVPTGRMRTDLIRCFKRFLKVLGADRLCVDGRSADDLGWLAIR